MCMYSETDARTLTSEAVSQAVERIRANAATMPAAKAVDEAIESMPGGFVIRPYLQAHKAEVRDILLTEYDEAESMGSFRKEGNEKAAAGNLASLMRTLEQLGVYVGDRLRLVGDALAGASLQDAGTSPGHGRKRA